MALRTAQTEEEFVEACGYSDRPEKARCALVLREFLARCAGVPIGAILAESMIDWLDVRNPPDRQAVWATLATLVGTATPDNDSLDAVEVFLEIEADGDGWRQAIRLLSLEIQGMSVKEWVRRVINAVVSRHAARR